MSHLFIKGQWGVNKMWLSLAILISVGAIGFIFGSKNRPLPTIIGVSFIVVALLAFLVVKHLELNLPTYDKAKYESVVSDKHIIFDSYTYKEDGAAKIITIPSHYSLKLDWINHWERCNSPISIKYYGDMPVTSRQSLPEPEIIGNLECK